MAFVRLVLPVDEESGVVQARVMLLPQEVGSSYGAAEDACAAGQDKDSEASPAMRRDGYIARARCTRTRGRASYCQRRRRDPCMTVP